MLEFAQTLGQNLVFQFQTFQERGWVRVQRLVQGITFQFPESTGGLGFGIASGNTFTNFLVVVLQADAG